MTETDLASVHAQVMFVEQQMREQNERLPCVSECCEGDIHYIWLVLTFQGQETKEIQKRKFMVCNNQRALQILRRLSGGMVPKYIRSDNPKMYLFKAVNATPFEYLN